MFKNLRGVRKLMIATMKEDTEAKITYDTPEQFAGVREIGGEQEESTATEFYDNQAAITVYAEGADKYKLVTSVLEDKIRAMVEGREYDEATKAYLGTPKEVPYVAIGFIGKDTNGKEFYYWIYKNKLTGGGESHKTEDNGTESTNLEWEANSIYTTHKFAGAKDKPLKFYKLEAGGTVTEEQFFSKVYTPDEASVVMKKEKEK